MLHPTLRAWLLKQWRLPILAKLLKDRRHAGILVSIVAVHLAMTVTLHVGWPCPVRELLGIRCPGCGLTAATVHFLSGHWHAAFLEHAMAPVFILGFFLTLIISLLPTQSHKRAIQTIEHIERHTGIVTVVMIILVVYWIIRVAFMTS